MCNVCVLAFGLSSFLPTRVTGNYHCPTMTFSSSLSSHGLGGARDRTAARGVARNSSPSSLFSLFRAAAPTDDRSAETDDFHFKPHGPVGLEERSSGLFLAEVPNRCADTVMLHDWFCLWSAGHGKAWADLDDEPCCAEADANLLPAEDGKFSCAGTVCSPDRRGC